MLGLVPFDFAKCATVVSELNIILEHNTRVQGECRAGYYVLPKIDTTSFDQVFNHSCSLNSGYSLYNRNYIIPMKYGVVYQNAEVTMEHNTKNPGDCKDGYYVLPKIDTSSFDQVFNHSCSLNSGYSLYNRNYIIPMKYGVVYQNAEVTLCDNGYFNGTSCVQYDQGNCPNNYVDLALNTNTIVALNANNACDSGYTKRSNESPCLGEDNTTTPTCMVMCGSGYVYDNGECVSLLCQYSPNVLETAAGNFNVYANHTTTPFLTAKYSGGNCYLKLKEGAATTNGINFIINNTTYHIKN